MGLAQAPIWTAHQTFPCLDKAKFANHSHAVCGIQHQTVCHIVGDGNCVFRSQIHGTENKPSDEPAVLNHYISNFGYWQTVSSQYMTVILALSPGYCTLQNGRACTHAIHHSKIINRGCSSPNPMRLHHEVGNVCV